MITLKQVHYAYPPMPMYFDLQLTRTEKVALIGTSGAGKSTLLNLIAGFEYAESGEIWLNGENHTATEPYQRPVSMLFQDNNLFNHLTVAENIALGLKPSLSLNKTEQQQVTDVAEQVGLEHYLSRLPQQLSGGQRQRVALARTLLRNRPILLLDEPFSALDPELRQEMLQLVDKICCQKQLCLLLVTHQLNEVINIMQRVIRIDNGRITENYLVQRHNNR
ncbi:thiamine ABC transporter ATP-binding protein [Gallibacterium anatis]|uniref:thiamine ABC transporter ATP-binding protein n=1 Tax=Gallibacterium anatis TaxID=750 RepID=UPI001B32A2DD|nr:thiamine ABC transporter ATP-binding protein [Gallibacterium anatis]MBP4133376.1 thiamine ABC transporter ATP-binding protein [Gallibacterium anatis]WKS96600.1 thiamine ABC transporter ATP-binding protein [Gallibacterium anatis]